MNFIMKKQMEMKKGSKKGFTLVEVIVVIVIIAILAAIAVPALTGYIEKASNRGAIVEAKNVLTALQSLSAESVATGAYVYGNTAWADGLRINGPYVSGATKEPGVNVTEKSLREEVNALIGSNYTAANFVGGVNFGPQRGNSGQGVDGVVSTFTFKTNSGKTVKYDKTTGFKVE